MTPEDEKRRVAMLCLAQNEKDTEAQGALLLTRPLPLKGRQWEEGERHHFLGATISSETMVGWWAEQMIVWRPGLSATNVTLLTWPRFSSNVCP
jgi:hypothetical protein